MSESPTIRTITLNAGGGPLSGLLAEPADMPPRAVVVALHGAGMRAGYFDSRVHPGQSLLELGAELGWTVLALDRPGYGSSTGWLPEGQSLTEQAVTVRAALDDFVTRHDVGAGYFLAGHSFGGKLVLTLAASDQGDGLIGLDVSGCGHQYAVGPEQLSISKDRWQLNWGKLRCYPPGAFRLSESLVGPVPWLETQEARVWPERFAELAKHVRAPVRLTFAEHEHWWRHGDTAVAAMRKLLSSARVSIDRQSRAGHNISLGWAARSYHLRALAFAEECLMERRTSPKTPVSAR